MARSSASSRAGWRAIEAGQLENPKCLEDIWVNQRLQETARKWYNTTRDYVQHTGNECRVAQADGAPYRTDFFVGE